MKKSTKHTGLNRHQARESILEVLYAWQSGGYDQASISANLDSRLQDEERKRQDAGYVREAVAYVTSHQQTIDAGISKLVRRSLRSIGIVELNILRLACWEMTQRLEIPYRIIINEGLELARDYAGEEARGFVNGVLDRMASEYRSDELLTNKTSTT